MLKAEVYDHPVKSIELIETHISWVILTGDFAYKIKKPVNFGFLDFSTLEKRHVFCKRELELNRRLAPTIYLEVVSISGTQSNPIITHKAEAFEYAVKMKQFPQTAQLDHLLASGKLHIEQMDAIADMVADFHQRIDIATIETVYGNSELVQQPVEENFIQIRERIDTAACLKTLDLLESWSVSIFIKNKELFDKRKAEGFIRECHGDMHLRNMAWLDDKAIAFDCIEFNAHLRWIDVMSEIAFLIMDLQDRQQYKLANRFLNTYLENTGDYAGLSVLSYYLCYRAMVRAKVDVLRLAQAQINEKIEAEIRDEFNSYLELAAIYTKQKRPKLVIMRGVSASGKSTVSQQLVDRAGVIRIRSDVERKRLFDIALKRSDSDDNLIVTGSSTINSGIYSKQASVQTYAKLLDLSSQIISAGYSVIVDAAFLSYGQRHLFRQLATHLAVPFFILELTAPVDVLKRRIAKRQHDVSDAGLDVLTYQLANWQALHKDELTIATMLNTEEKTNIDTVINAIAHD